MILLSQILLEWSCNDNWCCCPKCCRTWPMVFDSERKKISWLSWTTLSTRTSLLFTTFTTPFLWEHLFLLFAFFFSGFLLTKIWGMKFAGHGCGCYSWRISVTSDSKGRSREQLVLAPQPHWTQQRAPLQRTCFQQRFGRWRGNLSILHFVFFLLFLCGLTCLSVYFFQKVRDQLAALLERAGHPAEKAKGAPKD